VLCYLEKRFSTGKVDRATVSLLIDILDRTEGKSPTRLNDLQEAELIRQASTEELREIAALPDSSIAKSPATGATEKQLMSASGCPASGSQIGTKPSPSKTSRRCESADV